MIDRDKIIVEYLKEQIAYNDRKLKELSEHLEKYPDDEYTKQDKQNCYYLRNVLLAMVRRVETKN